MNNLNKITKILGATFVLVSANASALETVNGTASATVSNAFTFVENNGIDFGTIRATQETVASGTNVATLSLYADASTTVVTSEAAVIGILGTPAVASFSVSGVSPFTNLDVTFPAAVTTLTADSGAPNSSSFTIPANVDDDGTFDNGGWSIASGGSLVTVVTGAVATITSDVAGAVDFEVGAELTTVATNIGTDQYIDDTYSATYTITVDY